MSVTICSTIWPSTSRREWNSAWVPRSPVGGWPKNVPVLCQCIRKRNAARVPSALLNWSSNADGTRAAFRFRMHWHNTGTFFGHPPTGDRGTHAEFHSLRLVDGQIVEQIVTDISYGIPKYELTVWHREYPADTEDPAPQLSTSA